MASLDDIGKKAGLSLVYLSVCVSTELCVQFDMTGPCQLHHTLLDVLYGILQRYFLFTALLPFYYALLHAWKLLNLCMCKNFIVQRINVIVSLLLLYDLFMAAHVMSPRSGLCQHKRERESLKPRTVAAAEQHKKIPCNN